MRGPRPHMTGNNNPSKRPEVREKIKQAWAARRAKNNHKIIKIEYIEDKMDCYDLTVEKYHNFALSAGCFVHNCMLPSFGVALRTLAFEPNNATLVAAAQTMIANAIATWEPRVEVSNITVTNNFPKSQLGAGDNGSELPHILGVQIDFVDPQNISLVNSLVLELPLAGVTS
jgi:Baseplate wedge protein gp25